LPVFWGVATATVAWRRATEARTRFERRAPVTGLNPTKAADGNRRDARGGQATKRCGIFLASRPRPEGAATGEAPATIFGEGFSRRDARGGAPIRADPVCDRKRVARVPWMPPADAIEAI
jgi:hypothetical protein